jgi:hypothetical protein
MTFGELEDKYKKLKIPISTSFLVEDWWFKEPISIYFSENMGLKYMGFYKLGLKFGQQKYVKKRMKLL